MIDIAVDAGADAVKFQTFNAEELVTVNAPKAGYQLNTTDPSESQLEMIKKLELSQKDHQELDRYAKEKGIIFLSTPFDERSVDLLVEIGVPLIKVGSGEITNHPFLRYIAKKGLPIILSTGMSTLEEVREAVSAIREEGCNDLIVLHCTSNYPARIEDTNLLAMKTMAEELNVPTGYSDHTLGIYVPLAAVVLGACVIEKHFTLDRNLPGPDQSASLELYELKEMVHGIRMVEIARGSPIKGPVGAELGNRDVARRSIVAKIDIPKNTVIKMNMLAFKRPGNGMSPKDVNRVLGKKSSMDIKKDDLIDVGMLVSNGRKN